MQVAAALDARARAITFQTAPTDKRIMVNADRQMLGSAVSNLLLNAFKFSRRDGTVSLTARAEGGRILIEDECGGLPDGKAEELFRPFKQKSTNRTGLGLGLSISRRAVEANSGKLTVRSIPSKGCVFTIELPALDASTR